MKRSKPKNMLHFTKSKSGTDSRKTSRTPEGKFISSSGEDCMVLSRSNNYYMSRIKQ